MFYILLVIIIVAGETLIKNHVEKNMEFGERKSILNGKVILEKHHNYGTALNFLEKKKEVVKKLSAGLLGFILLLFVIFLPKKGNRIFKLSLSLILGGAISNVSDRFMRGYVVDYFSFHCKWKKLRNIVFNLADIFIFLGSGILFLYSLFFAESKSCPNKTTK